MTSPAQELRDAAAKLRAVASEVGSAPGISSDWTADGTTVTQGHYPDTGEPVYPVADAASPQCAAHIALMQPSVGLGFADWLEQAADAFAGKPVPDSEPALAVARQILGSQP